MRGYFIVKSVPELLLYFFVNTFVANNCQIMLFKIDIKQNSISFFGVMHIQRTKNGKRFFGKIIFSRGIDVHTDLAGRVVFSYFDGFHQGSHLCICKKLIHYSENTLGAFSAPASALKYGFSLKLEKLAITLFGNVLMLVLYSLAASL